MRSQSRRVGEGQTEKAEKKKVRNVRSTGRRKKDLRTHLVRSEYVVSVHEGVHTCREVGTRPYR